VFRIHDVYGSGSADPYPWFTDLDPGPSLYLTVGTFTSVFEHNQLLKRHKTVEIKVFLNFLLVNGRIRIRTNNFDPNLRIWMILRLVLDPDNIFNFTFVVHFVFLRDVWIPRELLWKAGAQLT
jgi:hypothetical protein